MKKFVGLVVVLAVLVLGGYYAMGLATERTIRANLASVNQSKGVLVEVTKYQRGWFTSKAVLDWNIQIPERVVETGTGVEQTIPAQNYKTQMPVTIYHGPIIFAPNAVRFGLGYGHTEVPLPEDYRQRFHEFFDEASTEPKLDIDLFVSYFRSTQIGLQVPAFNLIIKGNNGQFSWNGMDSQVTISASGDSISGDINSQGLQFSKQDKLLNVGPVDSNYNLKRTDKNLFVGDSTAHIPSIVISDKGQPVFEVNSFAITNHSKIVDNLFSIDFKTTVDKIIAKNQTFGPGKLEIAIRNLDADVLANLNQQLSQMQSHADSDKQRALLALLPQLPKLLSKGAEFEISQFTFGMPQGNIEGHLLITLPNGDSSNPFQLIQQITGDGKFKIPADVLRQVFDLNNRQNILAASTPNAEQAPSQVPPPAATAPVAAPTAPAIDEAQLNQQVATTTTQQITNLLTSGVLVQQGNDYVTALNLQQGKLTVNGQPFNPAMLKY